MPRMRRTDLPHGTVTFLFTDVEGSTKLLHELGAERFDEALAEHRLALRDAFRRHGGVEVDTQGDAFFVAFPTAGGALAAADEGTRALAAGPIRLRMGLHTGLPHLGEEGYVGPDVHLGARIAASGHGGQILVSKATRDLVAADGLVDLGEHRVKDFAEPVWIFQLGSEQFAPLRTISNTNLPRPASSFVGREREQAEIASLLRGGARLVTLSGPGGSGKTRLAIEAAAELVPDFANGVFWVGLSVLRDPALVEQTIGQAVGSKNGLAEHIADRDMLLLLDNFEQVVDAATDVSSLLSACPRLRVLATSRELLRIDGERDYPVPPLADHDAVELFCERSGVGPERAVTDLCSHLDNLPLAVELAAARAGVLSPAQILERLSQRLDLLKGRRDADPRQQTLRATIAWSHDLLDDEEQRLFARLAVFRGGCGLDAAERVADADVDTLQSLVDKSLLRHTDDRFWMLETIREYALERLAEASDERPLRGRHATYYVDFVEEAGRTFPLDATPQWLAHLDPEHDNVRRALEWARDSDDDELLVRLAAAVADYWRYRGLNSESRMWLATALERTSSPSEHRLDVLHAAVTRAFEDGDLARAGALVAEFRSAVEHAGETYRLLALSQAARLAGMSGDLDAARDGFAAVKALAAELGDRPREVMATNNLGSVAINSRDFRGGLKYFTEALAGFRETGDEGGVSTALANSGWCALGLGDAVSAATWFGEALLIGGRLGAPPKVADGAQGLAMAMVAASNAEIGAQLLGAASSLRDELGVGLRDAIEEEFHERAVAEARKALGDGDFAEAWDRGRAMTQAEIVELAATTLAESA